MRRNLPDTPLWLAVILTVAVVLGTYVGLKMVPDLDGKQLTLEEALGWEADGAK